MGGRTERAREFLRANGVTVGVAAGLVLATGLGVRWIVSERNEPPAPRKVMQFAVVNVQPAQQPKPPPPPPMPTPQKVDDEPQPDRHELRAMDIPPDAAPPPPGAAPAGPLALAEEGTGPGDAFNLVGNPGGRGILSGGGLGDGSGVGGGQGDAAARYAWFYARMQPDVEAVLRRSKRLSAVSAVAELRLWWDESGRITRVQPVRPNRDASLDQEFEALVGLQLRHRPPPDVPMPVVMRVHARRPR
jgi:outer membrane biosynthesis protein TonB